MQYCVNCGLSVGQCLNPFSSRWCRLSSSRGWTTTMRHWPAFHHISCHGCSQWWTPLLGLFFPHQSSYTSLRSCVSCTGWRLQSGLHSNMQSLCTSVFTGLHLHTLPTSFVRWQMSRLISDFVPVHLRHWLSAAPDCLPSVIELFQSPLLASETVCVKIMLTWLKTPIPAPKICFLGVLAPKHFFVIETPKGTSLAETTSYEPSCIKIGSAVFAVGDDKNEKGREGKGREGKERKAKSQNRHISRICREAPVNRFKSNFSCRERWRT